MGKAVRWIVLFIVAFVAPDYYLIAVAELSLKSSDVFVQEGVEGGFHIWVRGISGIGSVLLTESSADPEKRVHSYALRSPIKNHINGSERRVIEDKILSEDLHFIVDSTLESHSELGQAFHLFLPYVAEFGYEWTRSGELEISDGTFLNLRTFEKKLADYSGSFYDNPFLLRVIQTASVPIESERFNPKAVDSFKAIADDGGGTLMMSSGKQDILDKINSLLSGIKSTTLDLVLALDTTKSMEDDLPYLQENLADLISFHSNRFGLLRVGLLFYRDYSEEYLVKEIPFRKAEFLQVALDNVAVHGGRDIPEAVYEALEATIHRYDWEAETRQVILIGDAPPHPKPRGSVTRQEVFAAANEKRININTIIVEAN